MTKNVITKGVVGMMLGVFLLVGMVSPVAAQTTNVAAQNPAIQAQIQMLLQMVAQLQAMLMELQKAQKGNDVPKSVQGAALEHSYTKINSNVNGTPTVDMSSPLTNFDYDKSNPKTDVIEFRWKATNVPYDTRVEIVWERINTYDYSGPLGGGIWEGEIPKGASSGLWKQDISLLGSSDPGDYRTQISVLDKNSRRLTSSKWIYYSIIDSSKIKTSFKSCTIKTDKDVYTVGESIKVSWTSKGLVNPALVFDPNVTGVLHEMYGVSSNGSRTFLAKHENGAKGYEIRVGDEGKICSVGVAVVGKTAQIENLSISSITLSRPNGIGHTSIPGVPVPDQKVKVVIKNNEFGTKQLSGQNIAYRATLYEYNQDGKRVKTSALVAGDVLVPYANGFSEFEFNIEGGLPFDGKNMEKKYQVRVEIDIDNDIKESNENDNMKWSKTWITSYYKG